MVSESCKGDGVPGFILLKSLFASLPPFNSVRGVHLLLLACRRQSGGSALRLYGCTIAPTKMGNDHCKIGWHLWCLPACLLSFLAAPTVLTWNQ